MGLPSCFRQLCFGFCVSAKNIRLSTILQLRVGGAEAPLEHLPLVGVGEEEGVLDEVKVDPRGGRGGQQLLGIAAARRDVLDLVGVGKVETHLFGLRARHAGVVPPVVSRDAGAAAGREIQC